MYVLSYGTGGEPATPAGKPEAAQLQIAALATDAQSARLKHDLPYFIQTCSFLLSKRVVARAGPFDAAVGQDDLSHGARRNVDL